MGSSHFSVRNMHQMLVKLPGADLLSTCGVWYQKNKVLCSDAAIFLGSVCYGSNSRRAQAGLHCISVDKLSRLVADVSLPQTQTAEPEWHHIVINAYEGREERGILKNSFCPPEFWETDTQMHQSFLPQRKHLKQILHNTFPLLQKLNSVNQW